MKRSDKEGRWGDIPSARIRFACEAGFLVVVAVLAAIVELRPLAIIVLMGVAWLLVAVIERTSSQAVRTTSVETEEPELSTDISAAPSLSVAQAREAYRWLFWRRERAATELTSPTAALEERGARSHVRRIEPEPERAQEPPAQIPELATAGAAVTSRPLELSGLEEPPAPQPSAPSRARRFVQQRRAAPPVPAPQPEPVAREWNIWDLEKRAREQAGMGPHDEEWSALFTHLRTYASADGSLPKEFDGLVRESFGELIEAA